MERLKGWLRLKARLDAVNRTPQFSEGQIWWASLGANIGTEIDAKGPDFVRPLIVLKKFTSQTLFAIPTTTKTHTGNWYVPILLKSKSMVACLHQAKVIDARRLQKLIGTLSPATFNIVAERFEQLYINKK